MVVGILQRPGGEKEKKNKKHSEWACAKGYDRQGAGEVDSSAKKMAKETAGSR